MKTKRLKNTFGPLGRLRRRLPGWGSVLALLLVAATLLPSARAADEQGAIPVATLANKPEITIQGNVVVDESGAPTGFYELALCVRSPRRIYGLDPADWTTLKELTEAEYAQALAAIEAGDAAAVAAGATKDSYTVTYYPFSAASAVVNVNTDVLTAVHWDVQEVKYAAWDAATSTYAANDAVYPRGVDVAANADPDQWGPTDPDPFPDVTLATMNKFDPALHNPVALDAEGDRSTFTAAAQAVQYYEDTTNNTKAAVITLSAHAPDNKPVVYKTSTPVTVIRFSYDLKRFPKGILKENEVYNAANPQDQITGDSDPTAAAGFWLGLDRGTGKLLANGKTPLTWLADTNMDAGGAHFNYSDQMAARTADAQVVWTKLSSKDTSGGPVDWSQTEYYYYLGAQAAGSNGTVGTEDVYDAATDTFKPVEHIKLPTTQGAKVLGHGSQENPTPAAGDTWTTTEYSYYSNILYLNEGLKLRLVNDLTFKKPTGTGGGLEVLFYDWDDTLIGATNVSPKGDVRKAINDYVEKNLVHPDLRSTSTFMADGGGMTREDKLSSLDRQYTYRGKYAYTVGGDDTTQGVTNGPEYPLTNKLDYVFTKRVNTYLTQEESGADVCYVHPYSLSDPALDPAQDAETLYPYVYGWAVVEDDSAANGRDGATGTAGDWKVMHDAAKLEDTWTTMGVGELSNAKPGNIDTATPPTVSAVDPAAVRTAPAFLTNVDPTWADGTRADANAYGYSLSGESGYLRFADFSDIGAEMARYSKKDTLIVKAVYEPGTSLMDGNHYELISKPAYTKWNSLAANAGGAYKVQLTMERAYNNGGVIQGTTRVRQPVIRQENTIDYKWIADEDKGVNNDLDNADLITARGLTQTTYTKVDYDNGEVITFSMAVSARHNRVDYKLLEQYGYNFVTGTQRSYANTDILNMDIDRFVVDNYNYLLSGDSDVYDDLYDCDFSTKEGSHGFVLYGTLGHFLEQATLYNHGEISQLTYEDAVAFRIAMDANLRMDMSGTQPTFASNATLQNAFLAAAKQCEAHKNDAAYDCWDVNLDCAKLNYHQAQLFLIDFQANPGCDIRTVSDANAQKLPFCHYHVSCTGGHVPAPPTNWTGLMDKLREYNAAATGSDDKKNAKADLDAMDLATLESITGLRSDADGKKFATAGELLGKLTAAEQQLNAAALPASWVNLQYAIVQGAPGAANAMLETAQNDYFWYDGSNTAPKVNDFAGLLSAAEKTRTPVALKDGSTTFLPKSALAKAQFPADAEAYLADPTPTKAQRKAWVTLTDNLVPSHSETDVDPDGTPGNGDEYTDYVYGKFTDMDTFRTQFTTIYNSICDAGGTLPADANEWWKTIQTAMLPTGDNLGNDTGDGSHTFWWRGGNTPFKISNLTTLVECARRLNNASADPDAATAAQKEWDRLTVAELEGAEISQSLRWKGTDAAHPMYPYSGDSANTAFTTLTAADPKAEMLDQLKSAVSRFDAAVAARPGLALSWERIQYLLLNSGDLPSDNEVVNGQANYYWWKNGNTAGTSVSLSTTATADANLRNLIAATYRADFNDPGVTSSILAAVNATTDKTFWDYTKLTTQRKLGTTFERHENDQYDGPDVLADVQLYAYPGSDATQVRAVLDMLTGFRDKAKQDLGVTDAYAVPNFLWQQVQYYVLNSETYLSATDPIIADLRNKEKALAGDYWWYYDDTQRHAPEKPAPPPANEPSQNFVDNQLKDAVKNGTKIALTADQFAELNITGNADGKKPALGVCNKILNKLVTSLTGSSYVESDGTINLTWVQLQYYFATAYKANKLGTKPGTLADSTTALTELTTTLGFDQANFPAGVKTTFSLRPADPLMINDPDVGAQPPVTAQSAPTLEEIDALIEKKKQEAEALEQAKREKDLEIAALEAWRAQLEQAQETQPAEEQELQPTAQPSTQSTVRPSAPAQDTTQTPAADPSVGADVPVGPTPEDPAPAPADNHDERVEIPLGEEVQAAVRSIGLARTGKIEQTVITLWAERWVPTKEDIFL